MPATERYQVDVFAIIILIAAVLIMVFLIIVAVYFFNFMNLNPPSRTESTFLFWTTVVLGIIFLSIIIYAIIHIFSYKVMVYEEPKVIVTPPPVVAPAPPPVVLVQQQQPRQMVGVPSSPTISGLTNLSTSYSDIPVTVEQRSALQQELLNLGGALNA